MIEIIIGAIALLLLLFLSAMMSSGEVAFFSLKKADLELLKKNDKKLYQKIITLLNNPEKLLATILTGNNFINIAFVIVSVWFTNRIIVFNGNVVLIFVIQTICVTIFILIFGEIMPKAIATHNPLKIAAFVYPFIIVVQIIFSPIISLLSKTTFIIKNKIKHHQKINFDDLSNAIDLAADDLKDEKKILKGIVNFASIRVKEILIPRMDVKTVDIKHSFSQIIEQIRESGFSRIPVIKNSFDNIVGVLYIKDLLPHLHKNDFKWQSLIRPPYFVPESKFINDLLEEFQQKKIHMAIVIDEYGGMSGIVTLEDILEEIVGNIDDEFDTDSQPFIKINDYTYEVDGKMLINDFCHIANIDDTIFDEVKGDSETIAGLILQHSELLPKVNYKVQIANFTFVVKQADNRRIKTVQIILPH
ncbi:MAG: gliding motility-associated protein GldE [Bacteroidales bacterium]|nr:gliding motility-associated protein GldE [Bacteroidales bacterium]